MVGKSHTYIPPRRCIFILLQALLLLLLYIFTGNRQIASIDSWSHSIRHVACELVIPMSEHRVRCKRCMSYRGCLRVQNIRLKNQSTERSEPSSCTPYHVLTKDEMQVRMKKLHNDLRIIRKKHDRMKKRLAALVDRDGVTLDEQVCEDLRSIIASEGSKALEKTDCSNFQRIFWEQQVLAASKKDDRGMRWHPLMVKWCIYLRAQSQGAYETLRQTQCIKLPSQRTLRDYTHHLKPAPGYSAGVDAQLSSTAKLDKCEERDRCVLILLDEMYVKKDLVYNKITGELVGFVNLGDTNMHILAFERAVASESSSSTSNEPLASTMLGIMVRGLFTRLQFPYAYFPSSNLTGDLLYDPFWEAVLRLETLGFKVCIKFDILF